MSLDIQLIAGLGNPGQQYTKTRHNAGFWFLDALAEKYAAEFKAENKFSGDYCKCQLNPGAVWLLKPTTFMNRSGLSVKQLSQFYKISPGKILIVHDELDIPSGELRLKYGGGHGGHNGLRDIHAHMGKDYWRLRVGIGHPGNSKLVTNYVLSKSSANDEIAIHNAINKAIDEIEGVVTGNFEKAMNVLHTKN